MSLTPAQIADVQRTWEQCVPIADTAANLFYDRLFELDPKLRALFPTDLTAQKQKLMTMITTAVRSLGDLDALVPVLQSLGRRHVGYGVKEEHYPTVGAALLDTLAKGLGPAFTPTVKESWTAVYGVLSTTMIGATRS